MLRGRGEVRESGLTGVTRNHVSPCGSGGSNPPLSAIEPCSVLEIAIEVAKYVGSWPFLDKPPERRVPPIRVEAGARPIPGRGPTVADVG